ncbi:MAG: ZIP family metal transporter [Gaiellaceae bacterium]
MLEAFGWGFLAASSLIAGGAVALVWPVGPRFLGMVMAFGSGVLISAVSFELVQEAWDTDGGRGSVAVGLFAGSLVFYTGDTLIDRMGGEHRKHSGGKQAEGAALAIVLGTVLDGIPESIVLGLTLVSGGGVSVAFLLAVFISNVPEAFASSTGLAQAGWAKRRIIGLWVLVALVSGLSALAGFALFDTAAAGAQAFVLAFAAGGILTMLADTMMPEAYEHGGKLVGVVTTLGFAVSFGLSALT